MQNKTSKPKAQLQTRRPRLAAREHILAAAEKLLLEDGPRSLKLVAIAAAAGVVTATVIHHFASIDGIQTALMDRMARQLTDAILASDAPDDRVARAEIGLPLLFDAFESRGAARLAAWLELTGEFGRLKGAKRALTEIIDERIEGRGVSREDAQNLVLISILLAVSVGLVGRSLGTLMGMPTGSARRVAIAALQMQVAAMQTQASQFKAAKVARKPKRVNTRL